MYQGNNPIALQSQKLIINALLQLMEHKDFSAITVKELCNTAMVSRQTFYSLFDSKDEVIGLHLDALFQIFMEDFFRSGEDITLKYLCDAIVSHLVRQTGLLKLMIRSNLDHVVKSRVESYLSVLWNSRQENQEYVVVFLAGAIMSVISLAVKKEEFHDDGRISNLLQEMIAGKCFQLP